MWTHFVSEHHACKRERRKKIIFEPYGCAHSVFPYTQDVALWCGRERRKEQHILGKRRAVGSFWRVGALLHLLEKGGGGIPFSSLFPSKLTGNELLLNPSFHRPSSLHLFLSGELTFGECFFPLFTLFLLFQEYRQTKRAHHSSAIYLETASWFFPYKKAKQKRALKHPSFGLAAV